MYATTNYDNEVIKGITSRILKQNSFGYDILFTVYDESDSIVDLTSFTDATLDLKNVIDSTIKNITLSIETPKTDGVIKWTVAKTDLDTAGVYEVELDIDDGVTDTIARKIKVGLLQIQEEI